MNKLTENDILYEVGNYWVSKYQVGTGRFKPKTDGFIVWQNGVTCATAKGFIGYSGEIGLTKAKELADKLATKDNEK